MNKNAPKEEIISKQIEDLLVRLVNENKETKTEWFQPLTILLRLLASDKLSDYFRENLLKNTRKIVYNGKKNNQFIDEIYRLFEKSARKHYYYINAQPYDPKHHLWESFDKRKTLHTNLALNYELRDIFLRKEWDILLAVSETGNLLSFLDSDFYVKESQYESLRDEIEKGKRKLVLICSFEAVRQLYPDSKDHEVYERHRETIKHWGKWRNDSFDLLMMPFWQHNQHVIIFLKRIDFTNNTIWKNFEDVWAVYPTDLKLKEKVNQIGFILQGSFYVYRRGFSNGVDPLFIGINSQEVKHIHTQRDHIKLLCLFFTYVCRGFDFEKSFDFKGNIELLHPIIFKIKDNIDKHKTWGESEFEEQMQKIFLPTLYGTFSESKL